LIAVGILILFASRASAAEAGGNAAAAAKSSKGVGTTIVGEVASIDLEGKLLTVKAGGKDVQINWTDDTRIVWKAPKTKAKGATAADLKIGQRVSVRTVKSADGKLSAGSIAIRKGLAPKKAAQ
jgi:hypothetical protein